MIKKKKIIIIEIIVIIIISISLIKCELFFRSAIDGEWADGNYKTILAIENRKMRITQNDAIYLSIFENVRREGDTYNIKTIKAPANDYEKKQKDEIIIEKINDTQIKYIENNSQIILNKIQ